MLHHGFNSNNTCSKKEKTRKGHISHKSSIFNKKKNPKRTKKNNIPLIDVTCVPASRDAPRSETHQRFRPLKSLPRNSIKI